MNEENGYDKKEILNKEDNDYGGTLKEHKNRK